MRIDVRFFALQRALTGKRMHPIEVPEGADVAAAWAALVAELPELEPAAASVRFARNGAYVDLDEPLAEGEVYRLRRPAQGGDEGKKEGKESRHGVSRFAPTL